MARIKVEGYIDVENLDEDELDMSHSMGISDEAFQKFTSSLANLGIEDASFELVEQ